MKINIKPFPEYGCLSVCVKFNNIGPSGWKYDNPAKGWIVYMCGEEIVKTIFKSSRDAKLFAEKHFNIKGWTNKDKAPYHQSYAIPGD